jgi:hypothetical protein
MFRTIVNRIPLVLAVAAIASPAAQAANDSPRPESVATAVGFLAQQGLSQSQIEAWTTGVCSYEVKPSSCYVTPAESKLASRRLAEGFLQGTGLAPGQITSFTEGVCSCEVTPSSYYLTHAQTSLASERSAKNLGRSGTSQPAQAGVGFDWGDAGVGAGATLGVALLLAGLGASLLISRHNQGRPARRS